MINDPEIKKEIWDARVKIVIGRFIITAIQVMFVFFIVVLLLENKVFGGGDAFVKPVVLYFGVPLIAVVLLIGYQVSYKPKKIKIDLFTMYLLNYYNAKQSEQIPNSSILVRCFTTDTDLMLYDNIQYHCFLKGDEFCLFPYKAAIECLKVYQDAQIAFTTIKIKLDKIQYEHSDKASRTSYSYDAKKNLVVGTTTYETVNLHLINKNIRMESSIVALLDSTPLLEVKQQASEIKSETTLDSIEKKIDKLNKLYEQKMITKEEFMEQKKRLLDQI